eukprot:CAMPEP_0185270444 /NCGR_PEP_ID=MMETSP1359-20130426/42328_1 /TAXON_ID=552665 /ORGANISM="Bigelowiella longifila, Strain CCMP242" /LENGTH=267 /DNA_ID=CAMNT_0027862005 /DNA_START=118 /DNA_END=921 /DNA_ORIENTATION=+
MKTHNFSRHGQTRQRRMVKNQNNRAEMMEINCKLNGKEIKVVLRRNNKSGAQPRIAHLKQAIACRIQKYLKGVWTMKIFDKNLKTEFQDDQTLESYAIKNNSTVSVNVDIAQFIKIRVYSTYDINAIRIASNATVSQLLEIYERKYNSHDSLQLMFKGKSISEHVTFEAAGIKSGMEVIVKERDEFSRNCFEESKMMDECFDREVDSSSKKSSDTSSQFQESLLQSQDFENNSSQKNEKAKASNFWGDLPTTSEPSMLDTLASMELK